MITNSRVTASAPMRTWWDSLRKAMLAPLCAADQVELAQRQLDVLGQRTLQRFGQDEPADELAEVVVVPRAVDADAGLLGQHVRQQVEGLVEMRPVLRVVQDGED